MQGSGRAVVTGLLLLACGGEPPSVERVGASAGPQAAGDAPAGASHEAASADARATAVPAAVDAVAEPGAPSLPGGEPEVADPAGAGTERAVQDVGADALRRASAAYEGLRSLRADFVMEQHNPLLRSATTSRGTIFQRNPDRILLRFSDPAGDVIVGDGTHFWVYYPSVDAGQVLRAPAASAGGGVDLRAQFVGDPFERFDYTVEGRERVDDRPALAIALTPRYDMGYRTLRVWIDDADGFARRFQITEHNGVTRTFHLSRLERNPVLDDELFRFTPPPGARIVERD
jgi:outer membrane lipoprotein carrier protein